MPRNKDLPCASCGELMWRSRTTLPAGRAKCRPCRGLMHGTSTRYRQGCRCEECRTYKRRLMRDYNRMVKKRDGISPTQKYRPAANLRCECGTVVKSFRTPNPTCNDCRSGFYIHPDDRAAIFERDGWCCGICHDPVDPDAEPRSPWSASVDHIVPRSRGGDESLGNLRLAHLQCNIVRGAPVQVSA